MNKLYMITTDHFESRVWFRDEEDYKVAMNYVAVAKHETGAHVVAFILMSNHVHFIIWGVKKDAEAFIESFKKLYGVYVCRNCICSDEQRGGQAVS